MSLSEPAREALAGALGDAGVETFQAHDRAGEAAEPRFTLRPASGDALAAALAVLSARELGVLVRGRGSKAGCGAPVDGAAAVLETVDLRGIDTLDADDGVLQARAGTPFAELAAAAREAGWELPLDPPEGGTLGGAIACASIGPRFGTPRDVVLGLEVVTAAGRRTRCGGRVVKNVTGYDLAKLYTGSLGTLGVIEGAWLRLRPVPEHEVVLAAERRDLGAEQVLRAARLPCVRVAAQTADRLVFEVCGEARGVERTEATLHSELGTVAAEEGAIARLRELQAGGHGLLFRLSHLPSRAAEVAAALPASPVLAYPARGLVYLELPAADAGAASGYRATLDRVAELGAGSWQLANGPAWARRDLVAARPSPAVRDLSASLKDRFDPGGILNPGRVRGSA